MDPLGTGIGSVGIRGAHFGNHWTIAYEIKVEEK